MSDVKWKISLFVIPAFEQAKKDRWDQGVPLSRCDLHGTLFNEDEEPCWACYHEFEQKYTVERAQ